MYIKNSAEKYKNTVRRFLPPDDLCTFVTESAGEGPVMKAMGGRYKVITVKRSYAPKRLNIQIADLKIVFLIDILIILDDLVLTALLMTKRIDEVVLI